MSKGDSPRPVDKARYDREYNRIFKKSAVREKEKEEKKEGRNDS